MNRNVLETVMGALVLVVALIFLVFAYSSAEIRTATGGYQVSATFDHIDGIKIGSDVRISGIKVGTVIATELDPKTFQARVRMTVDKAYKLPVDTIASIGSSSLLGDNQMSLVVGNDDKTIAEGGEIKQTESPTSFMQVIRDVAFSMTGSAKPPEGSPPPPPPGGRAPSGPTPSGPTPSNTDPATPKP